jgi:hypothetical protein
VSSDDDREDDDLARVLRDSNVDNLTDWLWSRSRSRSRSRLQDEDDDSRFYEHEEPT